VTNEMTTNTEHVVNSLVENEVGGTIFTLPKRYKVIKKIGEGSYGGVV
jgi:hypothetical protein